MCTLLQCRCFLTQRRTRAPYYMGPFISFKRCLHHTNVIISQRPARLPFLNNTVLRVTSQATSSRSLSVPRGGRAPLVVPVTGRFAIKTQNPLPGAFAYYISMTSWASAMYFSDSTSLILPIRNTSAALPIQLVAYAPKLQCGKYFLVISQICNFVFCPDIRQSLQ